MYLGYNEVTKQYLKSLADGSSSSSSGGSGSSELSASGFTMSGDINMSGNEVIGLDDPSSDSSATSKKYVDDEIAKVNTGGLDQATADGRYLQKTDASTTYETQTDASNTYLSKTDATNTYAPVDASYTKSESDTKYELKGATGGGGGLSASGFTMTGDIDMENNKILKSADPITSKSATNKEYVDNNFLSKHDGLILGNIAMSGQSITNLNPTPQSFNDAVTKKYVDDSISLAGGLSITGITMQGDINMNGHNVTGLADPTNDDMAASKGYVDSNFLDLAGGTMVGSANMGGYDVSNLPDDPPTDNSAASKKYVDGKITGGGGPLTSGFSMTGNINMQQNEIINLPDVPSVDHSAASKKYVDDHFVSSSGDVMTGNLDMGGHVVVNVGVPTSNLDLTNKKYVDDEITKVKSHGSTNTLRKSGGTMTGDINMGGYEVIGVTSVPSFNNSLVNKKYVDDEVAAVTRGISQAQADARYLKLTKYEYDNWMDTFTDMSALAIVWSDHVRKSVIDSDTNLEIRTISVETSLSAAVIKARKIEIYVNYAYTSDVSGVSKILTNAKSLVTIDLSKKSYAAMNYKSSGTLHSFHVHEEIYVGNDTEATNSLLWQVGVKYEQHATTIGLFDECFVSFALNKAGQYG